MKRHYRFPVQFLLILVCGLLELPLAEAQTSTKFLNRDPRAFDFAIDAKAVRPGDLLFIDIMEQSDVENISQRLMRKSNNSKSEGQVSYATGGDFSAASANGSFDQETAASRQFTGDSTFRIEQGFIDRFTVRVIDTTANGNLLIAGVRHVSLEGDTRKLILTGTVRAIDISRDNTISSARVADLNIRYELVNGAERKFVNQGWLGKQFNKLWPY